MRRVSRHVSGLAGAVVWTMPALRTQGRFQWAQSPGQRDQEAFLAQFEPLDVLGLPDSCKADDVHDAHKRLTQKYSPQGPQPDPKRLERVERAYNILINPNSVYYQRAHASESDRKRLQFEMLPSKHRKMLQVHVVIFSVFVAAVGGLVIYMALKPMKNVKRAAMR